jgi:DNA-directed RNA polymerase specialized sigma24 family protein
MTDPVELLRKICDEKSEAAFIELKAKFRGAVINGIYRGCSSLNQADFEDVEAEVWEKVWTKACQFDPRIGKVGGWMKTIATNTAKDKCKKLGREERSGMDSDTASLETHVPNPTTETRRALDSLSECIQWYRTKASETDQRNIIIFIRIKTGQATAESIAEEYEVPIGTVYKRTNAGKTLLAECVRKKQS